MVECPVIEASETVTLFHLAEAEDEETNHTFVRSMSWLGRTRSPGAISSCKLPTALNATIALMPMLLKAAMLALEGTVEGVIWWLMPWRAIKAISSPEGRANMEMGDDGLPHGCMLDSISSFACISRCFGRYCKLTVSTSTLRTSERLSSLYRPAPKIYSARVEYSIQATQACCLPLPPITPTVGCEHVHAESRNCGGRRRLSFERTIRRDTLEDLPTILDAAIVCLCWTVTRSLQVAISAPGIKLGRAVACVAASFSSRCSLRSIHVTSGIPASGRHRHAISNH